MKWWTWPGSNRRPPPCKGDVITTRPQVLGYPKDEPILIDYPCQESDISASGILRIEMYVHEVGHVTSVKYMELD